MTAPLTPAQRLAVSRAHLLLALRDPVWLIVLQRWLHSQAKTSAQTPAAQTPASKGQDMAGHCSGD
jgi:hypothetical protein